MGEQRDDDARHAGTHGIRGAVVGGLIVGALGYAATGSIATLYSLSPAGTQAAEDYLHTICLGAPAFFFFYGVEGMFKGNGDTHRPMRAVAITLAINMVLDPLLIHTAGMGVTGAALATVIAFLGTALLLARNATGRGWVQWLAPGFDARLIGRIIRIGAPVSMHGILFSGVYIFIMGEVAREGGDAATAAISLGFRIEGIAYMTAVGLSTATAAMVGQNLGAKQVGRAHDAAWTACRDGVLLTGTWGGLMIVAPMAVVEWLSPGPATAEFASMYFKIAGAVIMFTAVEVVLEGAFAGAGNTMPSITIALPFTLIRIPAAAIAARVFGWGVEGIFWSLSLTSVVRGVLMAFWFARGRWARAEV